MKKMAIFILTIICMITSVIPCYAKVNKEKLKIYQQKQNESDAKRKATAAGGSRGQVSSQASNDELHIYANNSSDTGNGTASGNGADTRDGTASGNEADTGDGTASGNGTGTGNGIIANSGTVTGSEAVAVTDTSGNDELHIYSNDYAEQSKDYGAKYSYDEFHTAPVDSTSNDGYRRGGFDELHINENYLGDVWHPANRGYRFSGFDEFHLPDEL